MSPLCFPLVFQQPCFHFSAIVSATLKCLMKFYNITDNVSVHGYSSLRNGDGWFGLLLLHYTCSHRVAL